MAKMLIGDDDRRLFDEIRRKVDRFFDNHILCNELQADEDYVSGEQLLEATRIGRVSLDAFDDPDQSYEEELVLRALDSKGAHVLALVGSVGSGKTTLAKQVSKAIAGARGDTQKNGCHRSTSCAVFPMHIDCKDIHRRNSKPRQVIDRLRMDILDRIVDCWWAHHHGNDRASLHDDPKLKQTLQNAFLLHVIEPWSAAERFPFPEPTETPPLVETEFDERDPDSLRQLEIVKAKYLPLRQSFATYVARLTPNSQSAEDLTKCVLGYYICRCKGPGPQVFIIDNLDQLPSRVINGIFHSLYAVSEFCAGAKFIVPIRPSSIGVYSYVDNIRFIRHMAPCFCRLIHHKLVRYVLSRSMSDLCGREPHSALPMVWTNFYGNLDAVRYLVVTAYIFATIMEHGIKSDPKPETWNCTHEDHHDYLCRVVVTRRTASQMAEILGALVGCNVRYAMTHVSYYINSMFKRPEILLRFRRVYKSTKNKCIKISYRRLVETALFQTDDITTFGRGFNLFRPPADVGPRRPGWPSLVHLRILDFMVRERKASVGTVLANLALYGTPGHVVVAAINSLHDERRRLVWLSDNHNLELNRAGMQQEVHLASHGHRYRNSLLGAFDYVWTCAAQLTNTDFGRENFSGRLRQYVQMLQLLCDTEWKQMCFRASAKGEPTSPLRTHYAESMITLDILFSSLRNAAISSGCALLSASPSASQSSAYVGAIRDYVDYLAGLIHRAQSYYCVCYGTDCLRLRYDSQIESAKSALDKLNEKHFDGESERIFELSYSWDSLCSGKDADSPKDEISGLEHAAANASLSTSDCQTRLLRSHAFLRTLFEQQVPRYEEVVSSIEDLLSHIQRVCSSRPLGAAEPAYDIVIREQKWQAILESIRHHGYVIPEGGDNREQIDECKARFNKLMGLYDDLAAQLDVEREHRFKQARWTS